jgi:carboxypeptidase C (cathepsin A)
MTRSYRYLALVFAFSTFVLNAQPPAAPAPAAQATPPTPANPPTEKTSVSKHQLTVNGKTLAYTATAGTLILKKEDGKASASMFYVSYTRDDVQDRAKHPITFSFNGGPGSSSVWLHMGALGPKRVEMGADGQQPTPPYHLIDNADSALDYTDIVFIDPVSTGFSREAPGESASQFHGFDGDLKSVGEFIRLYTDRFGRWASPKFLAGESYGTTRAAALSEYLLSNQGIYLNGVVLISSVLNFQTISFAPGNDLPYSLYLPTYTATAWYHKKLPPDLQGSLEKAVGESRRFAAGDYAGALMKGDKMTAAEHTAVTKEIARLTGLSVSFVDESNLRIAPGRFRKELLRSEKQTVGRYDSRLKGVDADAAGSSPDYDASYASVQGVYTAMFNDYVRNELKYETDLNYEILTDKVNPWSYKEFENRYVNVMDRLREAMTQNHDLKVMVATGYYDLATPFYAAEYTVNHLGLDPLLTGHINLTYCEAGHMLYTKPSCLTSLHQSMAEFYQKSLPAK